MLPSLVYVGAVVAFACLATLADSALLFQYVTYTPLAICGSLLLVVGIVLTRQHVRRRNSLAALSTAAFAALSVVPFVVLRKLPTSPCKSFYLDSLGVRPGDDLMHVRLELGPYDPDPPYEPSPRAISFRCQSDSATQYYVMIKTDSTKQTVESVKFLLD